ncbi:MAG: GAF domain-containing protein [Vicinamibacterales bacterium]
MRRPIVRWSVFVTSVAVAAGCCYWAVRLEQRAAEQRRVQTAATADGRAIQGALTDARRALSAMASPGQAAVSWSRQATTSIEAVRSRLGTLSGVEGAAALKGLSERLDRLTDAETRVRDNAVGGRPLMASDVAFGEALPHVDAIDSQVADTVSAISNGADRAVAAARDGQLAALAGALAALGLAALILVPVPGRREPSSTESEAPATEPARGTLDLSLRPADAPPSKAMPARPAPDLAPLAALAAVCDGLAGLARGDELPAMLDQARTALAARGLAVWLTDGDRTALQVVASAGYDVRVVRRFPAVLVSDNNPTSRAYATGGPVVTAAGAGQPAAVTVPIKGARGTAGVLSAELIDGRIGDDETVARARIVAAQLAGLVEPLPRRERQDAPPAERAENA